MTQPHWAPTHRLTACRRCRTQARPHHANGYCTACYQAVRAQRAPSRLERQAQALAPVAETDWAYLAGLFDGMATITTVTPRRYPDGGLRSGRALLLVSLAHQEVIEWLVQHLGGSVARRTHPAHADRVPVYTWRLEGRRVKPVLENVLPYLRIKQAAARLVLEFIERHQVPYAQQSQAARDALDVLRARITALHRHGP